MSEAGETDLVFDVTSKMVIDSLPVSARKISSTTRPLSSVDVARYIKDADSEVQGLFRQGGISTVDSASRDDANKLIRAYAVRECLRTMGHFGKAYDDADEVYRDQRERMGDRPASSRGAATQFASNIDPDGERRSRTDEGRTFSRKSIW